MNQVYKFPLQSAYANIGTPSVVDMPIGAEIVEMAMQGGTPNIWAVVDPEAGTEMRKFVIYGTGVDLTPPEGAATLTHIGTLHIQGFVWHVFEATA